MMRLITALLPSKQAKLVKLAHELRQVQKMQKLSAAQQRELKTVGALLDRIEHMHHDVEHRRRRCIHQKFDGMMLGAHAVLDDVPLPDVLRKADPLVLAVLHKLIYKLAKRKKRRR